MIQVVICNNYTSLKPVNNKFIPNKTHIPPKPMQFQGKTMATPALLPQRSRATCRPRRRPRARPRGRQPRRELVQPKGPQPCTCRWKRRWGMIHFNDHFLGFISWKEKPLKNRNKMKKHIAATSFSKHIIKSLKTHPSNGVLSLSYYS